MLIRGRKFDLRIWVLFTHNLQVLVCKEGYARTTSYQFTLQNTQLQTHLTNNSVQSMSSKYSLFQPGNQLSFHQLTEFLYQKDIKFSDIFNKIKNIVKVVSQSVKDSIDKMNRKFCFQIFGWDFMLDYKGEVYLIQVNTNPTLQQHTMLMKMLIPRMLNDAFKLTIDVLFNSDCFTNYKVLKYEDKMNIWQHICWLGKSKGQRKW